MKTGVDAFVGLILDGGHHLGMAVTHVVHADTPGKIDELPAVHIDHHGPPSFPDEGLRYVEGSLGNMFVSQFKQLLMVKRHIGYSSMM
jgi:hypothetical protein